MFGQRLQFCFALKPRAINSASAKLKKTEVLTSNSPTIFGTCHLPTYDIAISMEQTLQQFIIVSAMPSFKRGGARNSGSCPTLCYESLW